MPVRPALLQRSLMHGSVGDANLVPIANALATLEVITREREDAWLLAHVGQLHKLLEKTLTSDKPALLDAAMPVLERVFRLLPAAPPEGEASG